MTRPKKLRNTGDGRSGEISTGPGRGGRMSKDNCKDARELEVSVAEEWQTHTQERMTE